MKVATFSVTAAGAALARRLPWEHRPGPIMATVRSSWDQLDGLVIVAATGIAVRAVGPLLAGKGTDPAVVSVDDAGRHAVALAGGHRGANELARDVAALLGAAPVVSTATDLAGLPALDALPGWSAEGDIAAVTRRWLDGDPPALDIDADLREWGLPLPLMRATAGATAAGGRIRVTDAVDRPGPGEVVLRPRSLVLGVGASRGADPAALEEAARAALEGAGRHPAALSAVATAEIKAREPAVVHLASAFGVPLTCVDAAILADRPVPNPSPVVAAAVGTASVAEAAALVVAGPESRLLAKKTVSASRDSTVAVARRAGPAGHLAVVGTGPGDPAQRTPQASAAIRHADVVIGYGPYVDLAADLLSPAQEVIRSPIGAETERAGAALARAARGARVALVCSGDPGVYAMASLVCELAPGAGDPPVTVMPGVTAALAGAAVLGAPLGHDHASISLSDLLTDWAVIARRLRAVAEADFVVSLYNPRSQNRATQLGTALDILSAHRPPATPAAVLTDIGRSGQSVDRTTLADLDPATVGMLSLVVIGSSRSRWISGRMVTPRGYLV